MVKLNVPTDKMFEAIHIDYTNWEGVRKIRHVIPMRIHFSANKFHSNPQWLMDVYDLDKGEFRSFAFIGIHQFLP